MAKSNYREYLRTDQVRFKKYFYVLRPILACKWILDRGTPPPMLFKTLMDCYLDESIKPAVDRLLDLKINNPEIGVGKRIDEIDKYIELSIADIEDAINATPADKKRSWNVLNDIFLSTLKKA